MLDKVLDHYFFQDLDTDHKVFKAKMPGVIAVSDFVRETREDFNSPTTSSFVHRIPQCKETVTKLEEVRRSFSY